MLVCMRVRGVDCTQAPGTPRTSDVDYWCQRLQSARSGKGVWICRVPRSRREEHLRRHRTSADVIGRLPTCELPRMRSLTGLSLFQLYCARGEHLHADDAEGGQHEGDHVDGDRARAGFAGLRKGGAD